MLDFFTEDIDFVLTHSERTRDWLTRICQERFEHQLVQLNYIFCSDAYLLSINQEYLDHDTYTDIITFDQSDEPENIEGDIFISVERVAENAERFGVPFEQELRRVLVHGLLHLLGLGDKTEAEKQAMRRAEDEALALF